MEKERVSSQRAGLSGMWPWNRVVIEVTSSVESSGSKSAPPSDSSYAVGSPALLLD
jgi:hypothetical protein